MLRRQIATAFALRFRAALLARRRFASTVCASRSRVPRLPHAKTARVFARPERLDVAPHAVLREKRVRMGSALVRAHPERLLAAPRAAH